MRPIILLSRSESQALCEQAGVPFVLDPSNDDPKYARNRVRGQLRGDPAQTEALLTIGAEAREAAERSSARFEDVIGTKIFFEGEGAAIDRSWILGLTRDEAKTFVSQTIRKLGSELRGASVGNVHDILDATGKRLDLGDGLTAWTDSKWLRLGVPEHPPDLPEIELSVPGTTIWGEAALTLQVSRVAPDGFGEVMDFGLAGPRLWVRPWSHGDRFRPLGSGQKKLQDFFVDEKVPRSRRSGIPVVHNGTEIVWVAGMRIADGFKVTSSTETFLSALLEHR